MKRTIAVSGTHGKTTTASMAAHVLRESGRDPGFLIGGELRSAGTNAEWGSGEWAVVEADESDRSFLKLDRDVAIKVLPQSVAADPDTRARFEREAKAVAALSHPNILSIFDFGTQDGSLYCIRTRDSRAGGWAMWGGSAGHNGALSVER